MTTRYQLQALANETAERHHLPPTLVCAVVTVESGWETTACRVEPHYRYLWDVRGNRPFRRITVAESRDEQAPYDFHASAGADRNTEWQHQQTSWGLMQIMGAVARERGCTARFLTALCEPGVGLEYGCLHLAHYAYACRYLDLYGWSGVCRAYNGGPHAAVHATNPEYPHKVLAALGGAWPQP